jgi:NADH-quinone oxidoreductase subunit F
MDLHFTAGPASPDECAALDAFVAAYGDVSSRRDLLLPALHAVSNAIGWISPPAMDEIGRRLHVAPADVYGVASFYASFTFGPASTHVVRVCEDLACTLRGPVHVPPSDDAVRYEAVPCLGQCERAPAQLVTVRGMVASPGSDAEPAPVDAVPQAGDPSLVLLRRVGVVDPTSIDDYIAHGGYDALRRAAELGADGVLQHVAASGLVGRGGAAFPTGRKWQAVAAHAVGPRYLVCNADEAEPGTFKDRVVLEGDPFSLIEAMTIAAFAIGIEHGFVYLRDEYPRAARTLGDAIVAARSRGLLGPDVMGLGFAFDIEIRRGAGAYICGEETAIFNSIEGNRGEPRNKPPFPVDVGLFGRPTVVNNVETLVNVLPVVLHGAEQFGSIGVAPSVGTKLFCVSGNVQHPGVYEFPFGISLRSLIEAAGGVADGRSVGAVLLGGAAGAFAGPADLDLPLTLEAARTAGLTLGSGVVMVLDDQVDMTAIVTRIAAFFRDESCGQCVPCRVGTVRQEELVHRLCAGGGAEELVLLRDVGRVMRDASICGLGQTASSAIESAIDRLGVFGSAK